MNFLPVQIELFFTILFFNNKDQIFKKEIC